METTSCQASGIPVELYKQFRQLCIAEDISVREKITRMIKSEVELFANLNEFFGGKNE